jgi:hypothetical protein
VECFAVIVSPPVVTLVTGGLTVNDGIARKRVPPPPREGGVGQTSMRRSAWCTTIATGCAASPVSRNRNCVHGNDNPTFDSAPSDTDESTK